MLPEKRSRRLVIVVGNRIHGQISTDADDTLKARGEEIRFRVRETAEWKKHAADLEMEMIKRGMIFEVINWSQGQAELPL